MASVEHELDNNSFSTFVNVNSNIKIEKEWKNRVSGDVEIERNQEQPIGLLDNTSQIISTNQHPTHSVPNENLDDDDDVQEDVEASNRAWFEKTFGSFMGLESSGNYINTGYNNFGARNLPINPYSTLENNVDHHSNIYKLQENSFTCSECGYVTSHRGHYARHMASHSEGEVDYVCPDCGYTCSKQYKLKKHMLTHSTDKPFQCDKCAFKGGTQYSLDKHKLIHTPGELPYACTVCDYRCYIKGVLEKHMLRHSGEKPFGCTMCNYKCTGNGNLKRHMMTHTGEKPFTCSECPHRCGDKDSLKTHMMIHTGEQSFSCTECNYRCRVKSALHRHMLKHTGEKPFECTQCEYKCAQITQLKMHMLNHAGSKPFACSMCEYACTSKGSLKSHMVSHTGVKNYPCLLCGIKFSANSTLKTHLLKHTGQKPFACTLCEYRCTSRSNLKKHIMIHTGDKPYICSQCNYRCSDKSSLNGHMKSKHLKNIALNRPLSNTHKSLWPCVKCGDIFPKKSKLLEHMATQECIGKIQSNENKNESAVKGQEKNLLKAISLATKSVDSPSLWPCVECGNIFQKKSKLIEHMSSQHDKIVNGHSKIKKESFVRVANVQEIESITTEETNITNGETNRSEGGSFISEGETNRSEVGFNLSNGDSLTSNGSELQNRIEHQEDSFTSNDSVMENRIGNIKGRLNFSEIEAQNRIEYCIESQTLS